MIFEFGIPNYRAFLLKYLSKDKNKKLKCICGEDKFDFIPPDVETIFAKKLIVHDKENILYLFNPFHIIGADIIFTTFNLRRPHTWFFVLLFPWKKWVFWGQGVWSSNSNIVKLLRNTLLGISHGYIVYTEDGKRNLMSHDYPAAKIAVANNTISVSRPENLNGTSYLLYIGRLQERKQVELVFPLLKKYNIKLKIVGDGDYLEQLLVQVKCHGVDKFVDLHPATFDENEIKNFYSGALAYISPGHVGLGVVNSFAYGCPVITIESDEHAPEYSYCNSENSYIAGFASGLESIIYSLRNDKEKLDRKKQAAFKYYVENLSVENYYSAFDKQFNKFKK